MTGLRFLRVTGALVASAFLLAGCMQLNMSLTVSPDDTVTGQLLITANKTALNKNKTPAEAFADLRKNIPSMPEGPETVYEDANRYGTLISYDHTPLAKFNSQSIKLVKNNGTYRFTLPLDPNLYGNFQSAAPETRQAFMKAMEFEIQITFPDIVLDSNGTEVGRTVTWQLKGGEDKPVQLFATAAIPSTAPQSSPATGGGGGGMPWLLIIGGAVVLAVAAVAVFLLMRRSGAAPAAAGSAEATSSTAAPSSGA
jgi:hypothetical protein